MPHFLKSKSVGLGLFFLLPAFFAFLLQACDCDGNGTSRYPDIAAKPDNLIYEAISVGQSSDKAAAIESTGAIPLTISEISISNTAGGKAFSIVDKDKLSFPLTLEPGKTLRLQIRYAPTAAGVATGFVHIKSDARNVDNDGETKIRLSSSNVSADLLADPNPLDFGAVTPQTTETKSTFLQNRGQAPVSVTGIDFERNTDQQFALVSALSFPLLIEPGKSVEVQFSYTPKVSLADENVLIRNDSPAKELKLRLVGQMAAPDIQVEPTRLLFDATLLGTKEKKPFVIRNIGGQDLEISSIALTAQSSKDFSLPSLPTLPLRLKPKEEASIEVEYFSQDLQNDQGVVEIKSNDPDSPSVNVTLEAIAKGCDLKATPAKLLFTAKGSKTVTLSNQGNEPCEFKKAEISAATSPEFSVTAAPPAQTIPPGGVLQISVSFAPTDAKNDTGDLIVESSDPDQPQLTVPLESRLGSDKPCDLKISPSIVNFGFVAGGKARIDQVTLENVGFDKCTLFPPSINPNPSQVFALTNVIPAQGQDIPSGSTFKLEVSFTPKTGTSFQGTLLLPSNDTVNPQAKVTLTGSTGQLCIEALPDPLDFGSVQMNCSSIKERVDIYNICNQTVQVTGIKFSSGTNKQEFFIKQSPLVPQPLAFGASFSIQLTYVPRDLGPDLGALEIENSVAGQSPIVVSLKGQGVATAEQTDTFTQLSKPQIDLLFVVDDSCSMSDKQSSLASNFTSFINWAASLQADFHIGITTTDVCSGKACTSHADCSACGSRCQSGRCQNGLNTGRPGCLRGNPGFVTAQTPNVATVFASNVRVGTTGHYDEAGLEASYLALQPAAIGQGGCNDGFYRKDAALSVIYVSDEEDVSPQTVDFYANFLINLKGSRNLDKIRASAIVTPNPKGTNCKEGVTSGTRYLAVANRLRGIQGSICANWGQLLSQLGAVTFGYRTQFFLTRPADPTTLQVKVNGQVVQQNPSTGWAYDTVNNSVNFASSAVPPAASKIEITYRALCLPP